MDPAQTVWVCGINSPNHAYAMQKAKAPQGVNVFYPQDKEKQEKKSEAVRLWAAQNPVRVRHFQKYNNNNNKKALFLSH